MFQAAMEQLLEGLDSIPVIMDDSLVYASDESQHDTHLKAVLE